MGNGLHSWKGRVIRLSLLGFFLLAAPTFVNGQTAGNTEVPEAFTFLDNLASEMKSIDDLFDSLDDLLNEDIPEGTGYKDGSSPSSLLKNSRPIIVDSLPDLCDEAIHDFRQSLKLDFIKVAGAPDGNISRNQFQAMVQSGLFPLKNEPAQTYFERHDVDRDQRLDINEFVPSPQEIAQEQRMQPLTQAYTQGQTYPTGQTPTTTPPSQPPPGPSAPPPGHPIYTTFAQVEQNISNWATLKGFSTTRTPDGKLHPVDAQGNIVPLPPGVIPPSREEAEARMREFARDTGGKTKRDAEGVLQLEDKDGRVVPLHQLPEPMRPPYLPPALPPGP